MGSVTKAPRGPLLGAGVLVPASVDVLLRNAQTIPSMGKASMPISAPRPCTYPGCGALVRDGSGRCEKHRRAEAKQLDAKRGTSSQRGYSYKWQQARDAFLRDHPLCECPECEGGAKQLTVATVVDHTEPHRLDQALASGDAEAIARAQRLFWDRGNWKAMSKPHHDKKTATEDSNFARRTDRGRGASKV